MTEDPLARLVEGIVSERAAREARLKEMVDQLVGKPSPPPQAPTLPPVPTPVLPPPPAPSLPPAGPDPVARFRDEITALRAEKEALAGKNLALYEELQHAQAAPLVKEDPQHAMLEGLVVDLRSALAREQAALAAERDRASGLEARLEAMARTARERDEQEVLPEPDVPAELLALRAGKADLAGKNAALYEELQRAQAALPQLEAQLRAERASNDQSQASLAQARADRARLEEMLKAREAALAEERQARIRLEVALRTAEVQARTLEESLRQREQVLAQPPAPVPAAPSSPPPAPPEPVRTPGDAAGQIQATRQAWLDAILKELSKK